MSAKVIVALTLFLVTISVSAQQPKSQPEMPRISPEELAATLNGSGEKPLVLQVGFARLFRSARIRGAEYAGPAMEPKGIELLRQRAQPLPRTAAIVIYCGCCPWEHCPNIRPAYDELRKMGFRNVKALFLPNNFKFDWDDKGYPTANGD